MPAPVFFIFGDREANVTHDEAREIAGRLRAGSLRADIMARVEEIASGPLVFDERADAEESLPALRDAISSVEEEHELSTAMKALKRRTIDAIDHRSPGPGLRLI
jgi:hypothetical protein